MLKSVMKYEFRSLWRLSYPWLIVMAAAMAAACGMGFLLHTDLFTDSLWLAGVTILGTYGLFVVAVFLGGAILALLPQIRFYRSCFSDEGYLTFMLPVSTDRLLLGKMIPACLFTFLASILTVVGYVVALVIPIDVGSSVGITGEILEALRALFQYAGSEYILPLILNLVKFALQFVTYVILGHAAICIGALLMKKHKLLGAVVFGFLIYSAVNTLSGILSFLVGLPLDSLLDLYGPLYLTLSAAASILLDLGLLLGAYFLCRSLLSRHLNLE